MFLLATMEFPKTYIHVKTPQHTNDRKRGVQYTFDISKIYHECTWSPKDYVDLEVNVNLIAWDFSI